MTVELYESMFAKRKYNVGHVIEQQWVFGGICREPKESFLFAVENRSAASLMKIIIENIMPGTKIISDCWKAYNGL